MQLYLTPEVINSIVMQTNREANERKREWNEKNPDKLRDAWKEVTDNEILHFVIFEFWQGSKGVTTSHRQVYGKHVKENLCSLRQCRKAFFAIY